MTTRRSAQDPTRRLAILVAGGSFALLAIGATWHLLRQDSPVAPASILDGTASVQAAQDPAVELSDPVSARSAGDKRVAAPLVPTIAEDSPTVQLRPLIGLEGMLSHSRLGPAFNLSSTKALAAVVSIGREKQYLTIPVTEGHFRFQYVAQSNGSLAIENGSRELSSAALREVQSATVEPIAPTMTDSASTLRFLDRAIPARLPGGA